MLNNILNKGIVKILKLFYNNKHSSFHLREIARLTNMNENSVYRFLNKLEKDRILKSKKDANLKKYYLNITESFSILSIFDTNRYFKLPSIKRKAIELFLSKLKDYPIIVILFGSTAKNSFTKNSDIDLLLVVNRKIDTQKAKDYSEAQTSENINDFQVLFKNINEEVKLKKDKVVMSALESGYPLTNHIEFYRCVFDEQT